MCAARSLSSRIELEGYGNVRASRAKTPNRERML